MSTLVKPRAARSRKESRPANLTLEPAEAAKAASLRYVSDARPGISRHGAAGAFHYETVNGEHVSDETVLARIKALVIPPAWTDVWICPAAQGHIQATGRDARGRKQYRYHARWRKFRDETKYERLASFGAALPRIRERVRADLARDGLPRDRVLAIVVALLESTLIRVGNEEYARANKSYGLTTLQTRHVQVDGSTIHFHFRGKSGKTHAVKLSDRRLAKLVKRCRELPGHELFQYLDEGGEARPIDSSDVNEYLHAISGEDFTAKDFRTWGGTLLAAGALSGLTIPDSHAAAHAGTVAMVKDVAGKLGNTPAVCRKCYIHPAILAAFEDPAALERWTRAREAPQAHGTSPGGLHAEERTLLTFLAASP